jgi:hypothetical protein
MEDGDPRKKLAYEESIRALEQQSSVLDELRSRTGVLLAALSLSASFLGAQALKNSGFAGWSWAAVGTFAASGLLSLRVLWPGAGWKFTANAKTIIEDVNSGDPPTLDQMYETYAEDNQEVWADNSEKRLKPLFRCFRLAVLALVLQVAFWLLALGNPHAAAEKTEKTVQATQRSGERLPRQKQLPDSSETVPGRNQGSP